MTDILVYGAGAWGTALACMLARAGRKVRLYGRDAAAIAEMQRSRRNEKYLPGIALPELINPVTDIAGGAKMVILACPSQQLRPALDRLKSFLDPATAIVITSKGVELETDLLMHEVARKVLPRNPVALLSGPSFAAEVAKGLPSAITIACEDEAAGLSLVKEIGSREMRPYYTKDVAGVAIGGAVKNVIAIAAGIVCGLGLGENARAAIITRGLHEIMTLAKNMGANPQTLMGLSGVGDLMLTCHSEQSRNFRYGLALGKYGKKEESLGTVEGAVNVKSILHLARARNVEMPISENVYKVLYESQPIDVAIQSLLARPFRAEFAA